MSRYQGPLFKKIRRLRDLLGLTNKGLEPEVILETNHIPLKNLNIVFV